MTLMLGSDNDPRNPVQCLNAELPIVLTFFGKNNDSIPEQWENAKFTIWSKFFGNLTDVKPEHP